MPSSIPNFSFLAQFRRYGRVLKLGAADLPRRPLADKFLYRALVLVNAYQCAKFELPSSISFRDKEGVPKFN